MAWFNHGETLGKLLEKVRAQRTAHEYAEQ